ncbi:WbqC family protein [Anabaena azotica]|uniref:WbqC family protein n=1 Tax=Anabaena azotica TaxID=197653 RepID=UPI0039A72214
MQPTYMPWAGYFNLISQSDVFVFLDDVQFEKSSWQNRNRILLNGQVHWITVPTQRLYLGEYINNIQINDQRNWRNKQFELIRHAYNKHIYRNEILKLVEIILDTKIKSLLSLNTKIIQAVVNKLELSAHIFFSSELNIHGQRSERLIKICNHFGCDEYLSPLGASEYLLQDGNFNNSSVRLLFQKFEPIPYPQLKQQEFVSHLSIIDIIANLGWEKTLQYIQNSN